MERILNGFLWALLIGVGGLLAYDVAKDKLLPQPFEQPKTHAAALLKIAETAPEAREPWIVEHFKQLPLPAQGPAPEGWSELETSLNPESCGACHPKQLAEWKTSWHAGAMGPGVTGQLIDWADKPGLKSAEGIANAWSGEINGVPENAWRIRNHLPGKVSAALVHRAGLDGRRRASLRHAGTDRHDQCNDQDQWQELEGLFRKFSRSGHGVVSPFCRCL